MDKGINVRERQIADLEGNYTYYYIGMIGLLILVFFVLFLLVWRFAFKTRKSKEETRKVMLTVTHEMRSPLSAIKDYARKISGLDDATDESKRYADLIVDTSKGLTAMIDSFGLLQISEWKGDRQGTPFPYDGHCRAIKDGV